MADIGTCVQEFPAMCARSALRKLSGAKPDWLYVAHVQSLFQAMKDEQHAKVGSLIK